MFQFWELMASAKTAPGSNYVPVINSRAAALLGDKKAKTTTPPAKEMKKFDPATQVRGPNGQILEVWHYAKPDTKYPNGCFLVGWNGTCCIYKKATLNKWGKDGIFTSQTFLDNAKEYRQKKINKIKSFSC